MSLTSFLLDLIFPPICLSCGKWGSIICSKCISIFQNRTHSICPTCLKNSPHGLRHDKCQDENKPIDGLLSYWQYNESLKKIITQIKYQGYYSGIDPLIDEFVNQDAIELNFFFQKFLATKPILIPIPIHQKRRNYRGFNQSEKIARQLSLAWKIPCSSKIIQRHINTHAQADLNKLQRQTNLNNAFSPTSQVINLRQKKPLKNQNIILVDDVWTTGSTMQTCARQIKKLGAGKIWALTIAR